MPEEQGPVRPYAAITLAETTIHNPSEPRHFMRLKPVRRRVRVFFDDELLADSSNALRLLEIGRDVYDPALYFPPYDVPAPLRRTSRTTHCPLKGDAVYYDLIDVAGVVRRAEIAWSYPEPFDMSQDLAGLIAFYTDQLRVEEAPL